MGAGLGGDGWKGEEGGERKVLFLFFYFFI